LTEDQLGKLMMLQATASTGTAEQIVAGDPINDIVFKLRRLMSASSFTIPNFYFRAANPEIANRYGVRSRTVIYRRSRSRRSNPNGNLC
jgi:hypothetical protein